NIDLPEPVGNVKSLNLGQTPSHDALVGLPDSFDYKVRQRSRLGLGSVQEIEELIHELVVRRQGEPLQHSAGDGGPDRAPELGVCPLHDERTKARGMLDRQFQSDGASKGNAENCWTPQTQLLNQRSEVVGIPGDVPGITMLSTRTGRGETVASQTVSNHLEATCQATCQGKKQPPASRQAGHKDQRLALAHADNVHELAAKTYTRAPSLLRDGERHRPRALPLRC